MKLEIINGVEGGCVSINNYRIAGPKPWGGGKVVKSWDVTVSQLQKAVPELLKAKESTEKADNSTSPKLPTLEELRYLMASTGEISELGLDMNNNPRVIKLAYECMCRQLSGE